MNRNIRILKIATVAIYMVTVFVLWSRFAGIGDSILSGAIHIMALNLAVMVWCGMVYVFSTCFFEKIAIQKKIDNASCYIGNISKVTLKSYRRSMTGDYVTMRFCSEGVPIENWESKLAEVQSVINYTIIGEIEYYKNHWDVIVFDARKGRPPEKNEVLYDDGF